MQQAWVLLRNYSIRIGARQTSKLRTIMQTHRQRRHASRKRMSFRLFGLFVLLLAFFLSACEERAAPPPSNKEEKLFLLATVYPLGAIAREIGGEHVSVEWLAERGQPLPGGTVSDSIRGRLRFADIVLSSGEPWAGEGHDDPLRGDRIVRLDVLHSAASSSAIEGLKWLDPAVGREVAEEIYRRLSARRPRLQPYFRARTDKFIEDLDLVTKEYGAVLTTDPPRRAMVLSADWHRLLARVKITPLMPVSGNPSALSEKQIRQLVEAARQNRVTTLFVHAETPPSIIRDLQDRTDLTVRTLDALGTSAGGERDTYVELLKYNLDQLNQGASRGE